MAEDGAAWPCLHQLKGLSMKSFLCLKAVAFVLAVTLLVAAQQTAPAPTIPSTGFAGLDQYRASRIAMFTDDFGQRSRYRAPNEELRKAAPVKDRVVFF